LKIVFCHILFIYFFDFLNAVWASTSGSFRIVSIRLFKLLTRHFNVCANFNLQTTLQVSHQFMNFIQKR